jgi:hypothetical protein
MIDQDLRAVLVGPWDANRDVWMYEQRFFIASIDAFNGKPTAARAAVEAAVDTLAAPTGVTVGSGDGHRLPSTVEHPTSATVQPVTTVASDLLDELRAAVELDVYGAFRERAFDDFDLGHLDGLLDALGCVPGAGDAGEELLHAAEAVHELLSASTSDSCSCGVFDPCAASPEDGMFGFIVTLLDTVVGRDDMQHCHEARKRAEQRQLFRDGTYDREALRADVLAVLMRVRHELPAKEIAKRIGVGVRGQQVGGALRVLAQRGLVDADEYRDPRTGYTQLQWRVLVERTRPPRTADSS